IFLFRFYHNLCNLCSIPLSRTEVNKQHLSANLYSKAENIVKKDSGAFFFAYLTPPTIPTLSILLYTVECIHESLTFSPFLSIMYNRDDRGAYTRYHPTPPAYPTTDGRRRREF